MIIFMATLAEFPRWDATAQAELVRRGEVASIELVEAAIARIEQWNPQVNAVITSLFEQARAHALSLELPDGPFRGVPLLLKDFKIRLERHELHPCELPHCFALCVLSPSV